LIFCRGVPGASGESVTIAKVQPGTAKIGVVHHWRDDGGAWQQVIKYRPAKREFSHILPIFGPCPNRTEQNAATYKTKAAPAFARASQIIA